MERQAEEHACTLREAARAPRFLPPTSSPLVFYRWQKDHAAIKSTSPPFVPVPEREGRAAGTLGRAARCCCRSRNIGYRLRCGYGCRRARRGRLPARPARALTHRPPRQLPAAARPLAPSSRQLPAGPAALGPRRRRCRRAMGMPGVSRLSCAFVPAGVAARSAFGMTRLLVHCVEFLPPAFKQSQPVLRDAEISGVRDWRGKGSIAELSRHTAGFP